MVISDHLFSTILLKMSNNDSSGSQFTRLFNFVERNDEDNHIELPISYMKYTPGWCKIFDIRLSPFYNDRATLYCDQICDEFKFQIGLEGYKKKPIFFDLIESRNVTKHLTHEGCNYVIGTGNDKSHLLIERFPKGIILAKQIDNQEAWFLCPYTCAAHLTYILQAFDLYIEHFPQESFEVMGPINQKMNHSFLRVCAERVLNQTIASKNQIKKISEIHIDRILCFYNACAQYFNQSFFLDEASRIRQMISDACLRNMSREEEAFDRDMRFIFNWLIAPITTQ